MLPHRFGSTGVEREHHQRVQHFIWIDRCRARSLPAGATFHLVRQVSSEDITSGCNTAFGLTPVEPNEMLHPLVVFSLDTCRSKCHAATTGDDLAQHLSIQMQCGTLWWCSRPTPVDPNNTSHALVMLSLDNCRTKWTVAQTGDDLARHMSIQMKYYTLWWCSRSTPVDPKTMRQQLVETNIAFIINI